MHLLCGMKPSLKNYILFMHIDDIHKVKISGCLLLNILMVQYATGSADNLSHHKNKAKYPGNLLATAAQHDVDRGHAKYLVLRKKDINPKVKQEPKYLTTVTSP